MPHFEGLPPLVPIHFWQKVRGLTPPLCSYIIRNVGSTPPTPEPVGVGDGHIFVQKDRLVLVEPTPRRLNTRSKVNSAPLRHITTEFPPLVLVGVTVGQHFNPSISNFDMLRHAFVAVSCQQFRF